MLITLQHCNQIKQAEISLVLWQTRGEGIWYLVFQQITCALLDENISGTNKSSPPSCQRFLCLIKAELVWGRVSQETAVLGSQRDSAGEVSWNRV